MKKEKIYRQIDVFDRKTEVLFHEIMITSFDLEKMKSEFCVQESDPLMYNPYEIDEAKTILFPNVEFNFNKYDYFLACYQSLSDSGRELLMINKFCNSEEKDRLIILSKSKRTKFRQKLAHFNSLNLNLFENLYNHEKETILKRAEKNGIDTVLISSESIQFDQKRMNLTEFIDNVFQNGFGNLAIFGDCEFVYYEGEGKNNRWISK